MMQEQIPLNLAAEEHPFLDPCPCPCHDPGLLQKYPIRHHPPYS